MSDPDRMDLHEFRASRRRKTDNLLKEDHRDLKRFFALDSAAYRDLTAEGGLDTKTKELLGLVASTVLRCNDCIAYHCDQCVKVGWKKAELLDALNVALVVGGSITIPHIRTVWEVVEQLYDEQAAKVRGPEQAAVLAKASSGVQDKVEEHGSQAHATLGLKHAGRRPRDPAPATSTDAQAVASAPAKPAARSRSAAPGPAAVGQAPPGADAAPQAAPRKGSAGGKAGGAASQRPRGAKPAAQRSAKPAVQRTAKPR